MKKILLFVFSFCSAFPVYSQWVNKNFPSGTYKIEQFQWINKDTAYATFTTSSGVSIYQTPDQGASWTYISSPQCTYMNFFDSKNGYFLFWNDSFYQTHDGGKTFAKIGNSAPITSGLQGMYFITRSRGLLLGSGDQTALTTDGGKNWNMLPFATLRIEPYRVPSFVDSSHGFNFSDSLDLKSTDSTQITYTVDGGKSWRTRLGFMQLLKSGGGSASWPLQFLTATIGYQYLYKTIDGGKTWFFACDGIDTSKSVGIGGIYYSDSLTGYAVTSTNKIYKTINGGKKWGLQTVFSYNLSGVADVITFANDNVGAIYNQGTSSGTHLAITTNAGGPVTNGVKEVFQEDMVFNLYPNPTRQSIKIEATGISPGAVTLTVTDMMGRQLINVQKTTNGFLQEELDISQLKPGIYSLCLQVKGNRLVKQFLVGE